MTTAHSSLTPSPLSWVRTARVAAFVVAVTATLAACSPAADEPADSATTEETTTADETTGDEGTPDEPAADGYTSDDVGNATLRIDGVEFPDFTGECDISRQAGKEVVGDLSEPGLFMIIALDNVKAHEEMSMNLVSIADGGFRFGDLVEAAGVGSPAKGELTPQSELGPRTADGSRDIVELRFAGAFEDSTPIEADIVCELQNAF
ncbi:hypothetical protein I6E68_09360 [Salinibacterium sp. NSLL150]|uniref:hypothetical protein n=1 Tax=unclassified Salinibacterium TaxID=2632331 RepID=UPI0018CD56B4|nr:MULTISPECIES: hypothetical protein [unclassified Salinibacterium]MBH0099346.1 hypothetical protein [Salinibacterium sp. NSLL35]MBH0102100.1 hypothetical protein [Salinibacterium sp. NSLL150]MBH0104860.1 hypothetical protein [Salinibacterium sp. NSLL16]MBH0107620.1 hypothetical protein [Salinibacterium sp. NSLL17]